MIYNEGDKLEFVTKPLLTAINRPLSHRCHSNVFYFRMLWSRSDNEDHTHHLNRDQGIKTGGIHGPSGKIVENFQRS